MAPQKGRLKAAWEEMKLAKRVNLPRLARQINEAARVAQQFGGPDRVYIASVWDVLHAERKTTLKLDEFKALLPLLQRRAYVTMTRLDLVGAAHARGETKLMERSTTRYLSAEWQLFVVPQKR